MSSAYVPSVGPASSRQPGAWRALLAYHWAVLRQAWTARRALEAPERTADEAAFLPAALSLQDTPVHPAPRRASLAITAVLVAAMAWAVLGRVDIVAVAPGRIVVNERSKLVQPLERGVVRTILVHDGEHVQAGQPLVQLDATTAHADSASAADQGRAAQSEMLRTRALASLLQHYPRARAPSVQSAFRALPPQERPAWSPAQLAEADAQLQAEWHDIDARLTSLALESGHRQAELATAAAQVAKLEATVPLAQSRERDFIKLVEQGYVSGHASQDKTRERVELERDLATQRARWQEALAAQAASEGSREAFRAETLRRLADRESQAQLQLRMAQQEQTKAAQRERLATLRAPVAGIVQQLAIHSVGGVVTEAQPLMVIVPDAAGLSVEANLDNRDIGFVEVGQSAQIKLETFPYTRYGTVAARVQRVTADAVVDEKRGAVFPATLALAADALDVDGRVARLSPGMNVTVEIKTGRRRVIEYLLSPIQKTIEEGLRER